MREGQFIKRNLDRWEQYKQPDENPDEIAKRFTYLVDDLAFAKTFYPKSNTVKYINGLAANIYLSIYRNKKVESGQLLSFWTKELPSIIRKYHGILLFSFVLFVTFVAIGYWSAAYDQTIIRGILGDDYVAMTERNIADGKPFAVYSSRNEVAMFLFIAFNNIRVAFLTFGLGITGGLGSVYLLFRNGLMVGVFQNLFARHHLGWNTLPVLLLHGTLELWSIVVAGCAGIVLGSSFLFPKTYTRLQAFKIGARDSMKIIVSLVPAFIIAAFFESFLTRHTEMPLAMSLGILLSSAIFIVWYYIVYPIWREKHPSHEPK